MAAFLLETDTWLPRPLDEVFAFYADAFNLETLTPPWMQFRVLTPQPIVMKAGQVIDYRLRIHGVPLRWRSLVAVWEPPHRFVDEQQRGPYRRWVHEHTFAARDGGTDVRDRVEYAVPGGAPIERLFVRPDLTRIFGYRHRRLHEIFGVPLNDAAPPIRFAVTSP